MKVVFCAAEASPFAKAGGLGDVVGSLPKALSELGDEVIVCIPKYGCIETDCHPPLTDTGIYFSISHQDQTYPISIYESHLPKSTVPVYFVASPTLFGNTSEIYPALSAEQDSLRFEVFGFAVLELLKQLNFKPQIVHLHDWHTANMAVHLKISSDPFWRSSVTVLSLHNMAYQGIVGETNWLKEGLIHSDALIAVSPTYAEEILTSEGGAGLEGILQSQHHKLSGILNGIDTDLFNPQTDPFLPACYTVDSVQTGKLHCKNTLQLEMGLPQDHQIPLFGVVARLVEQKGLDLILEAIPQLQQRKAQFVFLGTGQPEYENALKALNTDSPNIRTMIGFNMALGQLIYAGSDGFLMPSRFEPCGLGQMIALRYGSLPVVRRTGGLADTVKDANEWGDEANGFVFDAYSPAAFLETVDRSIQLFTTDPARWQRMVQTAMNQDFSWTQSAKAYQNRYHQVYQEKRQKV